MLFRESVTTRKRSEVLDLTGRVKEIVRDSGAKDGICVVYVPHTTAGVSINENADPDVKHDVMKKLEEMIPQEEK